MSYRIFSVPAYFVCTLVFVVIAATGASAQSSSFTYQGRLTDGGTPANGNYDLQFALWDSTSGGSQVGSTLTLNSVAVSNGVFAVTLDFGANSFPGASRFLEISARTIGAGSFTLLTPRQQVTSTPYAVRSTSAASADNATNATNATTATNATQLGGVAASQYVQTNDSRLTDSRSPTTGSANYIQNTGGAQTANFNISGNGTAGGTLSGGVVNAATQFNLGGNRILSSVGFSLFAGAGAGQNNTGCCNSFFGYESGNANTESYNSFFGYGSGLANTTGVENSFFGADAGSRNTNGGFNSFFGTDAGSANISGRTNSFFGFSTGSHITTGNDNSFFGSGAGDGVTTGSKNTFIGLNAGAIQGTSDGNGNTLLGYLTLVNTGVNNGTALGANAQVTQSNSLVLGSINGVNSAFVDTNVGIGTTAPSKRLEVGTATVADGINLFGTAPAYYLAGTNKSEKGSLAFAGSAGLYSTDAAADDTVLRAVSGRLILQRGSGGAGMVFNSTGTVSIPTLGSAGGTSLCRNSSNEISTCSSSLRYKANVLPFLGGLNIINRLRPISFTWKQDGKKDIGLGAEEVEQVAPVLTFRNDKGEIEGVKYNQLSAVFINAIKEQQAQIFAQQKQIEQQRDQIRKQQSDLLTEQQQARSEHALNQQLQTELVEQRRELIALRNFVCRSHARTAFCK